MTSPDSSWLAEIQKLGWRGEASVASATAVILLFLIFYDDGVWHKKMLEPSYFGYYALLVVTFLLSLFLLLFRGVDFFSKRRNKQSPQQIEQLIDLLNEHLWENLPRKRPAQSEMRDGSEGFSIKVTVSHQQLEEKTSYQITTHYSSSK